MKVIGFRDMAIRCGVAGTTVIVLMGQTDNLLLYFPKRCGYCHDSQYWRYAGRTQSYMGIFITSNKITTSGTVCK